MWKIVLALSGFVIFAVLFSLGNVSGVGGSLVKLLFTAFAAIFIMVAAISIAPFLSDNGR